MEGKNACETSPGPNVVECPTNFKTDQDFVRILAGDVSDRTKQISNPTSSDGKNTKKLAKNGKLSRKRKKPDHTQTSKREVKKTSRKRNWASVAASPSAVECSTNLDTEEDSLGMQVDEDANKMKTTNNPTNSDVKNTKKPAKNGKLPSKRKKPDSSLISGTEVKKSMKRNRTSVEASISADECPSTLITDENTMGTQAEEVSSKFKTTNNPSSSDEKKTKEPSKSTKHPLKRNKTVLSPMLQMIKSIKDLKKRKEASIECGTGAMECSTNLETEEGSKQIQASEVSQKNETTNISASSDEKHTKKPAGSRKLSQKRKKSDKPPTPKTVEVKTNTNLEIEQTDSVESIRPSVVESDTNPKDSMGIQASKVSNKIKKANNPANSEKKNSNVTAKLGKLSRQRKMPDHPPTSQMVMETIKALRKRNGASVDAILEHMESEYRVNAKSVKRYVTRYMKSAIESGIIEQMDGTGNEGRFKIRRAEKVAKDREKQKKTIRKRKK